MKTATSASRQTPTVSYVKHVAFKSDQTPFLCVAREAATTLTNSEETVSELEAAALLKTGLELPAHSATEHP